MNYHDNGQSSYKTHLRTGVEHVLFVGYFDNGRLRVKGKSKNYLMGREYNDRVFQGKYLGADLDSDA